MNWMNEWKSWRATRVGVIGMSITAAFSTSGCFMATGRGLEVGGKVYAVAVDEHEERTVTTRRSHPLICQVIPGLERCKDADARADKAEDLK